MLPDYTIRESARAKHVRFRVSVADGLVVVIPKGFDRRRIPALLEGKRAWLTRSLNEVEQLRVSQPSPDLHPLTVSLRAADQEWSLHWMMTDAATIFLQEGSGFDLHIQGPIHDASQWRPALKRWVIDRARDVLAPWTEGIAGDLDIPIQRVVIRCQKTRWGSYSTKGTISLNAQLILLPRRLARYVLVHEICHAIHTNHSPQFWSLVRQWEPEADRLRRELRTASHFIPGWLIDVPSKNAQQVNG